MLRFLFALAGKIGFDWVGSGGLLGINRLPCCEGLRFREEGCFGILKRTAGGDRMGGRRVLWGLWIFWRDESGGERAGQGGGKWCLLILLFDS